MEQSHHSIVYARKKREGKIVVLQWRFTKFNVVISTMQPFNNAATKDFFCKELSKDTLFMLLKSTANNNKRNKNIKKRKLHLQ